MSFSTSPARISTGSLPIGPGEQARAVELFRLAAAAEARKWQTAQRRRQQAKSTAQSVCSRASSVRQPTVTSSPGVNGASSVFSEIRRTMSSIPLGRRTRYEVVRPR